MSVLHILLAAVIVLGPLIAIHEFGHFWVARRLGVKVLTYSIGFGPALFKWRGRDGVDYQFAAIPLGGFVRMADEREGEVAPADLDRAFNRQSVPARMAIVAAGPLINLAFAVLLFWGLFLHGTETLRTVVGSVRPGTPAAAAGLKVGDEILAVDGKTTPDWERITYALVNRIGETGTIRVTVAAGGVERELLLPVHGYLRQAGADPLRTLGFTPYQVPVKPVIGEVVAGGPAALQGLQVGDRIVAADNQAIATWQDFVAVVRAHPDQAFAVEVERQGARVALTLKPRADKDEIGFKEGKLGIAVQEQPYVIPPQYLQRLEYGPVAALEQATRKTWELVVMTLGSLWKMLIGLVGLDNLSGPITIAKVAGHSADLGWQAVISFMALLSVSLGVLNLLPVPVLDGGHLVYYAIEGVLGKPLPQRIQDWGLRAGIALMGSLMLLAVFNDLARLLG